MKLNSSHSNQTAAPQQCSLITLIREEGSSFISAAAVCWNENLIKPLHKPTEDALTTEGNSGYPSAQMSCCWRNLNCNEIGFSVSGLSSERRAAFGWKERAARVDVKIRLTEVLL